MKRNILVLITIWAALGISEVVRAQVKIEGTVKLPAVKPMPPMNGRYDNKITGRIANPDPPMAVVYLEGKFGNMLAVSNTAALQMRQEGYQFMPGILPVQKGTKVEFPNFDADYHNVLSYSKAREFDLGRYRKDEKPPAIQFDKAGVIELNCEIHDHMRGYILVLDTPFFVKTDAAGKYQLDNLPAGDYTLVAWITPRRIGRKAVSLKAGDKLQIDFSEI